MTLEACLDYLALRLKEAPVGLKDVYSVTGSSQDDGTLVPVPASFDDPPVGLLWPRGAPIEPGNVETVTHRVELHVWERGTDGGYGVRSLVPFIGRVLSLMRSDLTLGGNCTKCVMTGYGEIFPQTMNNGQPYLVLPIEFEIMEKHHSHDYSV